MALLRRARIWAAAAAAATALVVCPAGAQDESIEEDVKAAYLFNFTKFVEWPPGAFTGTSDPLNVCVAGDATVLSAVERAVTGERIEGRPLRFVSPLPDSPASCHILYVGRGSGDPAERLAAAAASAPVLTVGNSPRFLERGGIIAFVVEARRVRFDVDLESARRAGLKISSKLLRVARHVHQGNAAR